MRMDWHDHAPARGLALFHRRYRWPQQARAQMARKTEYLAKSENYDVLKAITQCAPDRMKVCDIRRHLN